MTAATGTSEAHARIVRKGGTATVTVGDGTRLNALGSAQWDELRRAAEDLHGDPGLHAVVFRGARDTFCAGFRLHEWQGADVDDVDATFAAMEAALQAVERLDVPTIAAVDGVAAGAGCQLALACDLRVAVRSARLGMPIARLGILCNPGFALRLTLLTGAARAKELLYTGRLVGAVEAAGYGLVTQVVDDGGLTEAVAELLAVLAQQPRGALVSAKAAADTALAAPRRASDTPHWRFSDTVEFPARVRRFLLREQQRAVG